MKEKTFSNRGGIYRQLRVNSAWFDSSEFGVRIWIFSHLVPELLSVQSSGVAGCVPAEANTSVCVGAPAPSLRAHLYVTVPAALVVILAVKSNFFGHEPV